MNWYDQFHRLDFNYNFLLYNQVGPKAHLHLNVLINDRKFLLSFNKQSFLNEFIVQTFLINGLKQARSKFSVNLKAGVNKDLRKFIFSHSFIILNAKLERTALIRKKT